jgi:hypothetical protein
LIVHTKPEIALENAIYRLETVGRGASIESIASIHGKLSEGLNAIKEKFGMDVGLQIFDKREPEKVAILKGWDNLQYLEQDGNYEQVKARLHRHLEHLRGKISPDAYAQAIGDPPRSPEEIRGRYSKMDSERSGNEPSYGDRA